MDTQNKFYQEAIEANVAVHSVMVNDYNTIEPHYRPESIARVEKIIQSLITKHQIKRVIDFGCGTGFMIDILKKYVEEIIGIDITQAMLDKVDKTGEAKISLINADTGDVKLQQGYYNLATAYSFLDHLYTIKPTLINVYNSLENGGLFYADLSPNAYFWDGIKQLDLSKNYDQIIQREIKAVNQKGEEIEKQFGISKELFIKAEHQKHVQGGIREEDIQEQLFDVGFKQVDFIYHWFLGQAQLINDTSMDYHLRFQHASVMHDYLIKALPITRNIFKYVGFIAVK
ncbi:methyltransferase domain-containing protein [Candidatus Synechococcus calcipolaris G9]|uniref:Methyltransferase domain-containing protein n=1 Tax=Candidatus Synechococcus calcipolaris G9 TaxID=1497997 RepID=A0ABT6F3U0_9SYNE|nr:methyltransferase domain-containing protein [Candidatus Synechococcus calcipolaris]MDG2992413.1 methyltransferase domain-containing protein [Candidatus Synechococcus calcipolaris G9]